MTRAGLFLDRDGVVIRDVDLMTTPEQVELLDGVADAIAAAQSRGFLIVVVTNQSVVARGLCGEADVEAVHRSIDEALIAGGARAIDAYRFCPHHPHADDPAYRQECECRKPKPGMLLESAESLGINVEASTMIGDRPTDILAGHRAGCKTILVETGMEEAPLIVGAFESELVPADARVPDLPTAIALVLGHRG